jgi:NADH-quinone oxidoreductase subunit G
VATPAITRLDDLATATLRAAPDDIARLGFAVAAELGGLAIPAGLDDSTRTLARDVARALVEAERPLVVSGTSLGSRPVVEAAGQVAGLRMAEIACQNLLAGLSGLPLPHCVNQQVYRV